MNNKLNMNKKNFMFTKVFRKKLYYTFSEILKKYQSNNFFFIQIGACDGKTFDPIFEYVNKCKWKGILVEPIPYHFENLKLNYKNNEGLIFENSAISNVSGITEMYTVNPNKSKNLPEWVIGISSLSNEKNALSAKYWKDPISKSHRDKGYSYEELEKVIEKIKVNGITFNDLIDKYNVEKIDLLQIDTEGFDFEIIKQINFKNIRPKIINFEYKNIKYEDFYECYNYLKINNYITVSMGKQDLLAIDADTMIYLPF